MHQQFKSVPCFGEASQLGKASRGRCLNLLIALMLMGLPAAGQTASAAVNLPDKIVRIEQTAGNSLAMTKANLATQQRAFAAVLAGYPDTLSAIDPDNDHPLLGLVKGGSRMLTSIIAKRRNTEAHVAAPFVIMTIGIR